MTSLVLSPRLEALIARWVSDKARATAENYRTDLNDFCRFGGGPDFLRRFVRSSSIRGNATVLDYKADMLRRELSPNTINRRLSSLRSLLKIARVLGECTWTMEIEGVPTRTVRDTEGLSLKRARALLKALSKEVEQGVKPERAARDHALVKVALDHALRRSEIVGIQWPKDVDFDNRKLYLRGKGDRGRRKAFPLSKGSVRSIERWISYRGQDHGPLFLSLCPGRKRRLTPRGLGEVFVQAGTRTGIGAFHPHQLRHTAITAALEMCQRDLRVAQRFSRHASLKTLSTYDDLRAQEPTKLVDDVSRVLEPEDS